MGAERSCDVSTNIYQGTRRHVLKAKTLECNSICFIPPLCADRLVFHDQLVPRRHSDAVLGDQETRNGAHALGARTFPLDEHPSVFYQQL
jgi:hypothetical protein